MGSQEWINLPCELCGADAGETCDCPPCGCVWCRHERGEVTTSERRFIEARERALKNFELRRDFRTRVAERRAQTDTEGEG